MTEPVTIMPFEAGLAHHFRDLNLAWVQRYFAVEPMDVALLSDPKSSIIDKGGQIFFAKVGNEIAGTFALIREQGNTFELGKMAVAERYQGRGIGNRLLEACLQQAKAMGAAKVILYSNTVLGPAIHLYRKFGFVEVPLGRTDYKRSNIKMEKIIE